MKFKELKEKMGKMSGSKLTGQELSVYYRENPLAKKAARSRRRFKYVRLLQSGRQYRQRTIWLGQTGNP